jgi:hypothetical protein
MDNEIVRQDQYLEMEKRDEEQVLQELQGNIIQEMFYEARDNKVVISWVGIKEIARRYGGIEMCDPREALITDFPDFFMVTVKATDTKNHYSMLGASTQLKLMDVHALDSAKKWIKNDDGSWKFNKEPDPFCIQKAMSKAQRNAIRALIPEAYFAQMISTWKVGKIKPSNPQAKEPPKKVESTPTFTPMAKIPQMPIGFKFSQEALALIDFMVNQFDEKYETVSSLVYQKIVEVTPNIGDLEAAKLVAKFMEDKRAPPVEEQTPTDEFSILYNEWREQGLDGSLVEKLEEGKYKPKKFLGDIWRDYNQVMEKHGFKWIKAAKDSHWFKEVQQ